MANLKVVLGESKTVEHEYTNKAKEICKYTVEEGTASVTFFNETRELRYTLWGEGSNRCAKVYGVAVKYPTGTKVWNGQLTLWLESGNITVDGGLDYRGGHRRAAMVGFFDADGKHNSKHVGA